MKRMLYLLTLLLTLFSAQAFGTGVLMCRDINIFCFKDVMSFDGLKVYQEPAKGSSLKGVFSVTPVKGWVEVRFVTEDSREFMHYVEVGYEIQTLPVEDVENGFYKIKEGWLSQEEIEKRQSFQYVPWKDIVDQYLLPPDTREEDGSILYLQKGQKVFADKFSKIPTEMIVPESHSIDVLEISDDWVHIRINSPNFCGGEVVKVVGSGWIPIFTENGAPNFGWFSRGC